MPVAQLKIFVDLGDDFLRKIAEAMDDEINVSSKKWNYYPDADEVAIIKTHAYSQLKNRIDSVSNNTWDRTQNVVFSMPGPRLDLSVPSPEADLSNLRLIRARDGWIVDQDESELAVTLSDFTRVFTQAVIAWARTAVFYSVGSFKN